MAFSAAPHQDGGPVRDAASQAKTGKRNALQPTNVSRNDGNAGALCNDDDGKPDDPPSSRRPWPADIRRRRTESSPSYRPWFSPRRERSFHTDASHPGCTLAVPRRCPGPPHRPGNKQGHQQTMQASKPTGKYACGYLSFENDPAHGDLDHSAFTSALRSTPFNLKI